MNTLSGGIGQKKRLSLRGSKSLSLPGATPSMPKEVLSPLREPQPPKEQEPILKTLVELFDLTPVDRQLQRIAVEADVHKLARQILQPSEVYTREQIITRIASELQAPRFRGERGFNAMLRLGSIEETFNPDQYFLGGSTPF